MHFAHLQRDAVALFARARALLRTPPLLLALKQSTRARWQARRRQCVWHLASARYGEALLRLGPVASACVCKLDVPRDVTGGLAGPVYSQEVQRQLSAEERVDKKDDSPVTVADYGA